jgi:hypothetical protein
VKRRRARTVLRGNRAALDAIADALLREESLDREQLTALITAHHVPVHEPPVPSRLARDIIGRAGRRCPGTDVARQVERGHVQVHEEDAGPSGVSYL